MTCFFSRLCYHEIMDTTIQRKRFQLKGLVQGIGLRPLVYNLARELQLTGWVSNTPAGSVIEVEGRSAKLELFARNLAARLPHVASVSDWQEEHLPVLGEVEFYIQPSLAGSSYSTLFCPDVAFCPQCKQELLDENNRRYRYPFIGCPVCGPRFTVISELPYDRVRSSMASFTMCSACRNEYNNPAERRFHSQLNCCPDCGPRLRLWENKSRVDTVQPLEEAVRKLQAGCVVAVKGLGGFHLAVDAANYQAVERLRRRKVRPHKPLAVISADIEKIESFCRVPDHAALLLRSPAAPITLLKKRYPQLLARNLAPGNHNLGVMLPYTPLHYLLSEPFLALALTSGNLSDEPLVIDNTQAIERLSGIADYILLHDRLIQQPCDDSVVMPGSEQNIFMRRSRGFIPQPLDFTREFLPILACGGERKNTFAISGGQQVFVSQHLGDLKSARAYRVYKDTIAHFQRLLKKTPKFIAHDLHPDYLSTQYAQGLGIPACGVQHHHAHIASVMAEYKLNVPLIGVAWDGSGYGADGNLWGGEFLVADYAGYQRRAHFAYLPLPGGETAVYQPWRVALSLLRKCYGGECKDLARSLWPGVIPEHLEVVSQMLAKGINCPLTSSCGRLFDGIAAILGLCAAVSYEGQAAVALQGVARRVNDKQSYPYRLIAGKDWIIDPAPLVRACIEEREKGIEIDIIARRFHNTLAAVILEICCLLRRENGLNQVTLGGGVFQNELLLELSLLKLAEEGFEVFVPRQFPPNDGGLSLGQLLVAQAVFQKGEKECV